MGKTSPRNDQMLLRLTAGLRMADLTTICYFERAEGRGRLGGVTMGTDANVAFYVSVLQFSFSQAQNTRLYK